MTILSRFQFHKGTIRTSVDVETTQLDSLFQFHKGTIRTTMAQGALATPSHISIP